MSDEVGTFKLLWNMIKEYNRAPNGRDEGMIVSRYASIIDDRIENSGYSRSTDSLSLYTVAQLKEEIASRTHTKLPQSGSKGDTIKLRKERG